MKKAFIQLHIGVVLAGFTGVFGKLISLNEGLLVWYRMLLSGVLLLVILVALRQLQKISWRSFLHIGSIGFLLGLHWLFFYGSIKYSNISIGVVCYALTSFFTALLAPLLTSKKLVLSELLLGVLTLIGVGLIFSFDVQYRVGVALGVISSLIVACYTLAAEKLSKQYASQTITVYQMLGGFIGISGLMPIYLHYFPVATIVPSTTDTIYLLLLSFFCTVVLYTLVTNTLKTISAFTVNLTFNLEPLYAILLAMVIYQENKELTISFYVGFGLTLLSVALQMVKVLYEKRKLVVVTQVREI